MGPVLEVLGWIILGSDERNIDSKFRIIFQEVAEQLEDLNIGEEACSSTETYCEDNRAGMFSYKTCERSWQCMTTAGKLRFIARGYLKSNYGLKLQSGVW